MWGDGGSGRLGLGDQRSRLVPTLVPGAEGVLVVAGGANYSLTLNGDGTVMSCGSNNHGQLGLGDTKNRLVLTPVPGLRRVVDMAAGFNHSIAATLEGDVFTWGIGESREETAVW